MRRADFSAEIATSPLSRRQVQVVAAYYAGKTIAEIADELGIAASTVRMHLQRAESKVPGCHALGELMAAVARFAARRRLAT
jgi:DNA-binding NarL/FixJ family response regulator